ncbi:MAG: flagellar hook-length control protein FliK [Oscillospiraceae bacterium]|nr:flagellar hook-length control protein FliK [Oscillospiraceae bacterium]
MQIPMEILSQLTVPRTSLQVGTPQPRVGYDRDSSVFSRVFDAARTALPNSGMGGFYGIGKPPPYEQDNPIALREKEDIKKEDDPLGGVLGYQNNLIFILEREMESATTLETSIETSMEIEITDILTQMPTQNMDNNIHASAGIINENEDLAGSLETKNLSSVVEALLQDETNADYDIDLTDSMAGVVTARMPEIRTSEIREYENNISETSATEDLGPLENGNDAIAISDAKETKESENDSKDDKKDSSNNIADNTSELAGSNPVSITGNIGIETYQGNQQMIRAADVPIERENLIDEMVYRVEEMHTENQNAMTIQLKPEFLGKVALEIAMDASGLHLKISAADGDVRNMINGQINALIESLQTKGFEIVEVEVAYTGIDNGDYQNPQNNNQAQPDTNPRRTYSVDSVEDKISFATALSDDSLEYYLDEDISSVEYRA